MSHARLTDTTIRALKSPPAGQMDYWDETPGFRGFGVRVSKGGRKTFVLLLGSQRRRTTLGPYPVLSLAKAREKATILLAEQTLGIEPQAPTMPFGEALTLFFSSHCDVENRERTARETKRLLNRHFKPEFENKRLAEVKASRIANVLDAIEAKSERRHAFTALRTFFRFAVRRELVVSSPCERLYSVGGKAKSRERILSDDELRAVWSAADRMGYPFGTIVQLLILTGQRRGEIGGLRREWIKENRIDFPAEIMKAKKAHTIPLCPMAKGIIGTIPIKRGFLFPARKRADHEKGDRAFNGWSKDKAILGKRISPALAQWGLHDLRRTASTRWAELEVPPHINDMLLAHTMQGVSAVHRVYNLATYLEPMRSALTLWEGKIQTLLSTSERAHGPELSELRRERAQAADD